MNPKKSQITRADVSIGWVWSSTGHTGPRGGGRKAYPRTYRMKATYGDTVIEKTLGPAKHNRNEWKKLREDAEADAIAQLNK